MNEAGMRDMFAHAVIVAGVCLVSWLVFVKPKAQRLHAIEDAIARSRMTASVDHERVQQMADELAQCRHRIIQIEQCNALGDDTSRLYGQVSRIASEQELRVLHMDPGRPASSLAGGGGESRVVDVSVRGAFKATTRFLSAVEELAGFVRPTSLEVAPTRGYDGQDVVDARLTFELLRFDAPVLSAADSRRNVDDT